MLKRTKTKEGTPSSMVVPPLVIAPHILRVAEVLFFRGYQYPYCHVL